MPKGEVRVRRVSMDPESVEPRTSTVVEAVLPFNVSNDSASNNIQLLTGVATFARATLDGVEAGVMATLIDWHVTPK